MKTRVSFVSNSSSSSFILIGKKPKKVDYAQITDSEILKKIEKFVAQDITNKNIYLTQFVSDGSDIFYDYKDFKSAKEYSCGDVGGTPYDYNEYVEIEENVFLKKEDYADFYLNANDICASMSFFAIKENVENIDNLILDIKKNLKKSFRDKKERSYLNLVQLEKMLKKVFKIVPEIKDDDLIGFLKIRSEKAQDLSYSNY